MLENVCVCVCVRERERMRETEREKDAKMQKVGRKVGAASKLRSFEAFQDSAVKPQTRIGTCQK